MDKLDWYLIKELETIDPMTMVKCCGVVLSIIKQHNFFSFVVSDSTGTVEATCYENQHEYKVLELPKFGTSIILVGQAFSKRIGGEIKNILKLKMRHFKIISGTQEFQIANHIFNRQQAREEEQKNTIVVTKTKRSLVKEIKDSIESLELRNLILCSLYYTLENNPDLNSYTFSTYTIQNHRLTKSLISSKKLQEESVNYLTPFIGEEIKYLCSLKLIEEKDEIEGKKFYKINKKFFTDLEVRALGQINEQQGMTLENLIKKMNLHLQITNERNYAFSKNLLQIVVTKFIENGRIYKSFDKTLYPNY